MKRLIVFFLSLLAATWIVQAQKRPMDFLDTLKVKRITSFELSPDGKQVAYTVQQLDWEQNRSVTHIWVSGPGRPAVQMTNGRDGESQPRWAPDGGSLLFLAKRGGAEEKTQAYRITLAGGEALPLTRHKTDVVSARWAQDGARLYFVATDPPSEVEERRKKAKDDAFYYEHNFQQRHLWELPPANQQERELLHGDFSLGSWEVSSDGKKILYAAGPSPLVGDFEKSEIHLLDLSDGSHRQLTKNGVAEQSPRLSPTGDRVIFTAAANKAFEIYYHEALFLLPLSSQAATARMLAEDFIHDAGDATWSAEGKTIFFTANLGVRNELYSLDLESGKVTQRTRGDHAVTQIDYSPGSNMLAYLEAGPDTPGRIWITPAGSFQPVVAADLKTELEPYLLARWEAVRWKSKDGHTAEGLLIYPVGFQAGQRYPLLTTLHGGPAASSQFNFRPYLHALAGKGYAIFDPNYRGSRGYGDEVLRALLGHYFEKDIDDIQSGIDWLVERGIADPARLGVFGWSAGGHLTNWLITHSDRFKAASSGAGVANWVSLYAQSDTRTYRTPWFGSDPWEAQGPRGSPVSFYMLKSPISYVYQTKTPTLLFHGEKDERVPMPQNVELYQGLKHRGVPVEFVVFPREGHGPRETRHQLYKMLKEFSWFEKYLMGRTFDPDKAMVEAEKKD